MSPALYTVILALIVGCGEHEPETDAGSGVESLAPVTSVGGGVASRVRPASIPIHVLRGDADDDATGATAFQIDLDGCLSGQVGSADESAAVLQAYRFDQGCKAKLTMLEIDGRTLVPTLSDPFTSWNQGDLATFDEIDALGKRAVTVEVLSQLADPVAGDDVVAYGIKKSFTAQESPLHKALSNGANFLLVDDAPPPFFAIKSASFVGFNSTGGGRFTFVLECLSDMGETEVCETVDLADTSYRFVETTSTSPLTLEDVVALAPTGAYFIQPADRVFPGDSGTINGGFRTVTLDGPGPMTFHPQMALVIQAGNKSYQYFDVKVSALDQR